MALVAIDSFAMYNGVGAPTLTVPSVQLKWTFKGSAAASAMVTGLLGTGLALQQTMGIAVPSESYERAFTAARANGANGFAYKCSAPGTFISQASSCFICCWNRSGIPQFGLVALPNGAISISKGTTYNAQGVTALATSVGGVLIAGTRHYIEVEWLISATVGAVTVYIDGVAVITLTGANTKGTATSDTNVDGFNYNRPLGSSSTTTVTLDSYYEADTNTRIGQMRVDALVGASDNSIQWTNSAGSGTNFSKVNELPCDGDTTYVQDSTVTDQDLYGFGAVPNNPTTIFGVQPVGIARKTDATARTINLTVKSGGTTETGASFALSTSYARFERMDVNDPNTSAPWTYTNVNAVLGGPKVAS